MDSINIKINGVDFKLKKTFRGLLLFEEMTGTQISEMQETTNNMLRLFYCMLRGANKDNFSFSFDEFLDILDSNESLLFEFSGYMESLGQPAQKKIPKKRA